MHLQHNDELPDSRWHKQHHGALNLPVYVRDSTLLTLDNNDQKPDYARHEGAAFRLFYLKDGCKARCDVPTTDGSMILTLKARRQGSIITVSGEGEVRGQTLCLRSIPQVAGMQGRTQAGSGWGMVVSAEGNTLTITPQNTILTTATLFASGEGLFTSFLYKK